MKVLVLGLEFGIGIGIGVTPFCLCAAIAVVSWQELSSRRRQRMINQGMRDLTQEDNARRPVNRR